MKTLADRFRFFHENAGHRSDGQRPTGKHGRATDAMRLARAEEQAEKLGLWIHWTGCEIVWDGEGETPDNVLDALVYRKEDNANDSHTTRWEGGSPRRGARPIASTGMIGIFRGETNVRDYLRCVAAELYAEALEEIDSSSATDETNMKTNCDVHTEEKPGCAYCIMIEMRQEIEQLRSDVDTLRNELDQLRYSFYREQSGLP